MTPRTSGNRMDGRSNTAAIKVAIIGGGCAAVSAAFELSRPEHEGRYQVTVYQLGWRLGGKGASGRGAQGRIEEHGLHLWMGFYENAFRLMRQCYEELARDPERCPIAGWRDAFEPAHAVGVTEQLPDGTWVPWIAMLPPNEGLPGDPYPGGAPRWSVNDYVTHAVALVRTVLGTFETQRERTPSSTETEAGTAESTLERVTRILKYGELASLAALIEGVELLQTMTGGLSRYPDNVVLRFLEALATNARSHLEGRAVSDQGIRRAWTILDLTLATLRGIVRFGLLTDPRGFDAIDDYECREWLLLNGAAQQTVNSAYLRGLYDLGFSYEDGDPRKPRISAGQALRGMGRAFFTYRGAFFWKMQAGMGDVVFAPLYEVLERRGVRFRFFHRLTNVGLVDSSRLGEGDVPYVETLEFDVQAELKDGEYRPLVDVGGLPSWPSTPDYDQLAEGGRLRDEGWDFESHWESRRAGTKTLRVGEHFDFVVLGVGLGAVRHVCRELVARDSRWRAMVDQVKTVATQAFQLWLRADMRELGWTDGPITLSGFVEPFETWADMAHLLPREDWPQRPRALAYFCSVLPDGDQPVDSPDPDSLARRRDEVRRNAIQFLNRDLGRLWPAALRSPGEFRWDLLIDPRDVDDVSSPAEREERFASQFWTANVNPSDRYVLSLPGSAAYRLSPLDATYDNLTIAGDWTDCGFNAGCVEAAVMSGRLAAHAISRLPRLEDIVGYDHP